MKEQMDKVQWGMIGCGEVAEMKSGPAFNLVIDSCLRTVMCRNAEKAADYAARHRVLKHTCIADELISDPVINAIYIATPPSSHEQYVLAAIAAGKCVYIEKPMAMDFSSALRIVKAANDNKVRLSIAHYRREQPLFKKIKELLDNNVIGEPLQIILNHYRKPLTSEQLSKAGVLWRLDPSVSGGGLFHDVAPHQLDLLRFFFGDPSSISGMASKRSGSYVPPDHITARIKFGTRISFSGEWDFNSRDRKDMMEIIGTRGKILFGVFQHDSLMLYRDGKEERFAFDPLTYAQLPMIKQVVEYFRGESYNPCTGEDGAAVMEMVDLICRS